ARFHLAVIDGIRRRVPGLAIGVRLSAFDGAPFRAGPDGVGVPDLPPTGARETSPATSSARQNGRVAGGGPRFGVRADGLAPDLAETCALIELLRDAGVAMICVTAGSPYYNPHVQRPAYFPPSDGYLPPEDPLVGVARLLGAAAAVKAHRPDTIVVGSGY